jgi:hypothetical protein
MTRDHLLIHEMVGEFQTCRLGDSAEAAGPEKPVDDQNKSVKSSSPNAADSTAHYRNFRSL